MISNLCSSFFFLFTSFHLYCVFGIFLTSHLHSLACMYFKLDCFVSIDFDPIRINLMRYIFLQFNLIHQTPSLIKATLVNRSWMSKLMANSIHFAIILRGSSFKCFVIQLKWLIYWMNFSKISIFLFADKFFACQFFISDYWILICTYETYIWLDSTDKYVVGDVWFINPICIPSHREMHINFFIYLMAFQWKKFCCKSWSLQTHVCLPNCNVSRNL